MSRIASEEFFLCTVIILRFEVYYPNPRIVSIETTKNSSLNQHKLLSYFWNDYFETNATPSNKNIMQGREN